MKPCKKKILISLPLLSFRLPPHLQRQGNFTTVFFQGLESTHVFTLISQRPLNLARLLFPWGPGTVQLLQMLFSGLADAGAGVPTLRHTGQFLPVGQGPCFQVLTTSLLLVIHSWWLPCSPFFLGEDFGFSSLSSGVLAGRETRRVFSAVNAPWKTLLQNWAVCVHVSPW